MEKIQERIEKIELFTPPIEEISKIIESELKKNFSQVQVEVVPCPDMSAAPWNLAKSGLGGTNPCIGEIGGVPYLMPTVNREKIYDLRNIGQSLGFKDGLLLGAGAGPFHFVGKNSEMISNLAISDFGLNNSKVVKMDDKNLKGVLTKLPQNEGNCAILMNFFLSQGSRDDPVLKIKASRRTGDDDFIGCIRKGLKENYSPKIVGLGGCFQLKKGSAKIHVMPDFSHTPLKTLEEINNWLKFFEMEAPMTFMTSMVSEEPVQGVRLEHSHGYGENDGGHYHCDTTPEEVEYEGYFNIATTYFAVDRPATVFKC